MSERFLSGGPTPSRGISPPPIARAAFLFLVLSASFAAGAPEQETRLARRLLSSVVVLRSPETHSHLPDRVGYVVEPGLILALPPNLESPPSRTLHRLDRGPEVFPDAGASQVLVSEPSSPEDVVSVLFPDDRPGNYRAERVSSYAPAQWTFYRITQAPADAPPYKPIRVRKWGEPVMTAGRLFVVDPIVPSREPAPLYGEGIHDLVVLAVDVAKRGQTGVDYGPASRPRSYMLVRGQLRKYVGGFLFDEEGTATGILTENGGVPGYYLVSQIPYAFSYLRHGRPPLSLGFSAAPLPNAQADYFGKKTRLQDLRGRLYVQRIPFSENGAARGPERLNLGDILLSVDGREIFESNFVGAIDEILHTQKTPVELEVLRPAEAGRAVRKKVSVELKPAPARPALWRDRRNGILLGALRPDLQGEVWALGYEDGIEVVAISPRSPFSPTRRPASRGDVVDTGLMEGDIILTVDGERIRDAAGFPDLWETVARDEEPHSMVVLRRGRTNQEGGYETNFVYAGGPLGAD